MILLWKEAYIEYLKYVEIKYKPQTKRSLIERFESKINPYFKDYNIYEIKEIDYLNWQIEIEKNNYSNNYKINLHYLMSGFFEYLIKYFNVKKNIPKIVGNFKLKNENKIYNTYNYNDFKKFIKCFDNKIYKEFFNLMFFTGCRPGEAMALRFSNLKNRILYIKNDIDEHGNRVESEVKTKSSIRNIMIDNKLNNDLLDLKKIYKNKYGYFDESFYIFGGIKPLAPTTINRYKIKACNKANIKPIKLHEFRHSHATLLIEKGMMINEVSRRLGHSNTSITLNTYCHATKEHEKKVIKTLNLLRLFQ